MYTLIVNDLNLGMFDSVIDALKHIEALINDEWIDLSDKLKIEIFSD